MASYSRPMESRQRLGIVDLLVAVVVFALLYALIRLGSSMTVRLTELQAVGIDLAPRHLPYYAGRSVLRMFLGFTASLIFTFIYGYIAAKSRLAGAVLVPLLDILQSVPVLGFLSATITVFMALFPGRLTGVEMASIFAIFTGQAWNMTFSFYHSLITVPKDLHEAARIYHLNPWQQFIHLEVPYAMIGLVWNSMMSFGGGWFFLAASESITVLNRDIRLPGIGTYLTVALEQQNMSAVLWAIVTMVVVIVLVDQLVWRPVVAWSQKYKMELSEGDSEPTSAVLTLVRRSVLVEWLVDHLLRPPLGLLDRAITHLARRWQPRPDHRQAGWIRPTLRWGWLLIIGLLSVHYAWLGIQYISQLPPRALLTVVAYGALTGLRVVVAVVLGALWTVPVGVAIGLSPRLARIAQPLVQIAASFPANMTFPFVTILYLRHAVNFELGAIPLMMLGTQWYILFNVIAGAMAIPSDLKEAAAVFKLSGWKRWQHLILPGIFPFLVTGCLTAAGGAWNASIVAETISWGSTTLSATGLGAYINQATQAGNWPGIIWGITVMAFFVVTLNRLLWRRLYHLAENQYRIG